MRVTALHLAWRNLAESRLTAILMIGAVAAGVGFQIPNTANLGGYRAELIEHGILTGFGDVRIRAKAAAHLLDGRARATVWRADPRVREAAIALTFPGTLGRRGRFQGAPIFGVDMARDDRPFRLLKGLILPTGDPNGVIVGTALAQRLGIELGDRVELRAIYGSARSADDDLGRYTMTVRGLAAGTFGASQAVFVDYLFLAQESGLEGATSIVLLYLRDHGDAAPLAAELSAAHPDVEALDWMTDDPFIRSAIRSIEAMSIVSEAMVICAVAIPVLALMFIQVLHRRRDIGVLAAMGFGARDVFWVFVAQAAVVGVVGALVGCGLGYGLIQYFQSYPLFAWNGFIIEPVPSLASYARPALVLLAVTLCASVLPSWRAARVDPARVLRGGL